MKNIKSFKNFLNEEETIESTSKEKKEPNRISVLAEFIEANKNKGLGCLIDSKGEDIAIELDKEIRGESYIVNEDTADISFLERIANVMGESEGGYIIVDGFDIIIEENPGFDAVVRNYILDEQEAWTFVLITRDNPNPEISDKLKNICIEM